MLRRFIYLVTLAVATQAATAQINLTPPQLQPPGDTPWNVSHLGLSGLTTMKLLVEHSGTATTNSFLLDSTANGFPGPIGTATDDILVIANEEVPGKLVTITVPPNAYPAIFHDITDESGEFLSGPNGVLDANDAYLNSDPSRNITRVGGDLLVKYYIADPTQSYQFTEFGHTVQLGSGFTAFIFFDEDHTPNYDFNDMVIGVLPACQKDDECDDGDACNGVEFCLDGACRAGIPVCYDGIPCTLDTCGPDSCLFLPRHLLCSNDAKFCNGVERCDVLLGCLSPGDPCPANQFCNEVTNQCDECRVDVPCDDGDDCTSNDACVSGQCVGSQAFGLPEWHEFSACYDSGEKGGDGCDCFNFDGMGPVDLLDAAEFMLRFEGP